MAKLTFTYDVQKGYVSNAFSGGVSLQNDFTGKGKHVIFIESRLDESMPWATLRTVVVKAQDVFIISESSDGQVFRIICESEPTSVDTTPLNDGSSSGGSNIPDEPNHDGEVNTMQEIIDAFKGFKEGETIKDEIDNIVDDDIDEELEHIYFPKSVSAISADDSGDAVVLSLTGENINEENNVHWTLTMDGVELDEIDGIGDSLTLDEEQSALYRSAGEVKAKIYVGGYESAEYTVKGTQEGLSGGGTDSGD